MKNLKNKTIHLNQKISIKFSLGLLISTLSLIPAAQSEPVSCQTVKLECVSGNCALKSLLLKQSNSGIKVSGQVDRFFRGSKIAMPYEILLDSNGMDGLIGIGSLTVTYNKGPRILKNCSFDISDVNLTKANTKDNYLVSYTLPKDFPEIFLENRTDYSQSGERNGQQHSTGHQFWEHEDYSMQSAGRAFTDFSCPSADGGSVDTYINTIYRVSEVSKKCNLQEFVPEPFNYENGY